MQQYNNATITTYEMMNFLHYANPGINWFRQYIICIFLLSLFISPVHLPAQNNLSCYACGEAIKGTYVEADGKYFHPVHFICDDCKKIITGSFTVRDGRFFHPECYPNHYGLNEKVICSYCNKTIRGEFITSEGKNYHRECYENHVVPRCSICDKPLLDQYSIDLYGNKYHSSHNNDLHRCDNCGRIISEAVTRGGKAYSDGRYICNICFSDAVNNDAAINSLLDRVILRLNSLGLRLSKKNISIRGVDKKELQRAAGSRYDANTRGFCQSSTRTEYSSKKPIGSEKKHFIFVLNGVPSINIESVIAHELMHVWIDENTQNNQSDEIKEGSCNYISYLYLSSIRGEQARQVIMMLENDTDEAYGKGFRKIKAQYENRNLTELLSFLKR